MGNALEPLYYAIVRHFMDGNPYCADDVIDALKPAYGGYKLLTPVDVEEALVTAKENGLLDESSCDLDSAGNLRIFYQVTDFGWDMISKYI